MWRTLFLLYRFYYKDVSYGIKNIVSLILFYIPIFFLHTSYVWVK